MLLLPPTSRTGKPSQRRFESGLADCGPGPVRREQFCVCLEAIE